MTDAEFLAEVRKYIEEMEERVDGEWGLARELHELIADGKMPELYTEVLRRIEAAETTKSPRP